MIVNPYDLLSQYWNDIYVTFLQSQPVDVETSNKIATASVLYFLKDEKSKNNFYFEIGKLLKKYGIKNEEMRETLLKYYFQFYKEKIKFEREGHKVGTKEHIELLKNEATKFLRHEDLDEDFMKKYGEIHNQFIQKKS